MDESTKPLSAYGSSVTVQQNLIPRHYLLDLPQATPAPSMEVQVKDQDGNLYRGTLYLVEEVSDERSE